MQYAQYLSTTHTFIPNSTAEECTQAFFRFLELNGCQLNTLPLLDPTFVIQKGLVFNSFNPSAFTKETIFKTLYASYIEKNEFDPALFSILSALALFIVVGATNVAFPEETPDSNYHFNAGWNHNTLEVKVVRLGEEDAFSNPPPELHAAQKPINATILAIDTNLVPNSFTELAKLLENFFPVWPHISGVLAYTDYLTSQYVGWECQFFVNLKARLILDSGTLIKITPFKQRMVVAKQFT